MRPAAQHSSERKRERRRIARGLGGRKRAARYSDSVLSPRGTWTERSEGLKEQRERRGCGAARSSVEAPGGGKVPRIALGKKEKKGC